MRRNVRLLALAHDPFNPGLSLPAILLPARFSIGIRASPVAPDHNCCGIRPYPPIVLVAGKYRVIPDISSSYSEEIRIFFFRRAKSRTRVFWNSGQGVKLIQQRQDHLALLDPTLFPTFAAVYSFSRTFFLRNGALRY